MTEPTSPGARFRKAVRDHRPLQIVGAVNAYCAMLAEEAGHRAVYLSGAGVANASYGLPDLGVTGLGDVVVDVERITGACELPLLVDIDTGWGGALSIARAIASMERAGAAAVHIEDQVAQKRCGHRPNKAVVGLGEMVDRIKAAADARKDADFLIMARTDALAVEGADSALDRAAACVEAGADAVFPEAVPDLELYRRFAGALPVPVLANITEFGVTPLLGLEELRRAGVAMALYPLSAFRAMSKAALDTYRTIAEEGGQSSALERMQPRSELYDVLNYREHERRLDRLSAGDGDRAAGDGT